MYSMCMGIWQILLHGTVSLLKSGTFCRRQSHLKDADIYNIFGKYGKQIQAAMTLTIVIQTYKNCCHITRTQADFVQFSNAVPFVRPKFDQINKIKKYCSITLWKSVSLQ